jgi:uncharacterized membrane protein YfcA
VFALVDFLVFFVAWFFQAFTGFGAGIFIVGILSLFHTPHTVIVSSALINLIGTSFMSLFLLRFVKPRWDLIVMLILGSVPGIFLGTSILLELSKEGVKLVIGLFILAMGLYDIGVQRGVIGNLRMTESPINTIAVGFIAGIFAGLVGMGGPPPVVYLNQVMGNVEEFKFTLTLFFTSNIVFRLLSYKLQGGMEYMEPTLILYSALAIPLGILLGLYLSKRVSVLRLKRIISYSVALLGAGLVVESGLI